MKKKDILPMRLLFVISFFIFGLSVQAINPKAEKQKNDAVRSLGKPTKEQAKWQDNKKSKKNVSISEGTEWSNTWMVSTRKHDLPRVLIIGDSHVERYYPMVTNKLNKKAYCCKFTTSRSLGDPALIAQLKALFFSFHFDVITFNNGLHGVDYSDEQYSRYIPVVYKLFKKSNPGLKLIWVNTTPRRIGGNRPDFDQYNQGVINRNKAVEDFTSAKNIPLVDFYTPASTRMDFFDTDGIHFSKLGVEEQARMLTSEILNALGISER